MTEESVEPLVAAKCGRRVAVVIPARDEAQTVGDVVARVRVAFCGPGPRLVDELVVIDSDSTDDTVAVAREAGAVVHSAKEIRPDLGWRPGKGEALWKSLFVTTSDVICFLDADLVEWGTHFVPALLGPLLHDRATALVKAVYHRPLLDEAGQETETGGRVTELVARPLLALHFPELAATIQPLSGEWAVRRDVFERLWVPSGYGVEIAALVDTAREHGPASVAQADLGRRAHRHHRHDTLGSMAVQVMSAIEARLGFRSQVAESGTVMLRQFEPVATGFAARDTAVDVRERPPAITVEGYADGTVPG